MNEPDNDLALSRLFDGFEAEMARRVVVPGADEARRAAYGRGRRNSRVVTAFTAFTAIAAIGVGGGVTYTVAGQGGLQPEPQPTASPSQREWTPTPSGSPVPSPSGFPVPSTSPMPSIVPTPPTAAAPAGQKINLTLAAPAELRLTSAPSGGWHGKLIFTVRNEGPSAMTSLGVQYNLGSELKFESGVDSSGAKFCLTTAERYTWGCNPDGQYAVGSAHTYEVNLWTGVAADGSEQVFELKIYVLRDSGVSGGYSEQSPADNTATVRVIVPKA